MTTDHTMGNAYEGLVEADRDSRWAFGGGFDDPLAGMDTSVPPSVDAGALALRCLELGDDALVMAQRLNELCTHAPELEEEVALANIALDLLGQTRLLYARAVAADPTLVPELPDGSPVPPEDRLAFFRDAEAFLCRPLAELPNRDFAHTVVRLAAFSELRYAELEAARSSGDPVLAAIAEKAVKELRYHRDWAQRWVEVLLDGTEESRRRTEDALEAVRPWLEARDGHTEWLAALLAEMQSVARAHPMGRW